MSKERTVAVWPACTYMDGVKPVELAVADEDDETRCPREWAALFKLHHRQGKFPYMYSKLTERQDQSAVARAFRNYMRYVLDYDGHRIPDEAYEPPP